VPRDRRVERRLWQPVDVTRVGGPAAGARQVWRPDREDSWRMAGMPYHAVVPVSRCLRSDQRGRVDVSGAVVSFVIVTVSAFLAGCIDAIAGGGGLIQLPALLAVCPDAPLAGLFGTNKFASVWGTGRAAASYARHVRLPWRALAAAVAAAAVGSCGGAWLATRVPDEWLRITVPALLLLVLVSTLRHKQLGTVHAPRYAGGAEAAVAAAGAAAIGFYDGLFGPGTGSFLVFLFVRVLGYDFLHASAAAKAVNIATNLAALAVFVPGGHIRWPLAVAMAVANVAGSGVGTQLALRRGSGLVRAVFIAVVSALLLKTGYDAFLGPG
jgi:uncharacterized membrane protein YfcA